MKQTSERGAALLMALVWIIVVSAGSALIVVNIKTSRQATEVQRTHVQGTWAVEGALETALHALRSGTTPSETLQIGGETVRLEITTEPGQWLVRARTHPTTAEIYATFSSSETGRIERTGWTRVR